ncbi:MAG TPA: potassium channel family protein [Ktedonobacterales bacterium]|nr:potassium channel family protein [Ktedonobacterales bacterium]
MEERSTSQAPHKAGHRIRGLARPADSFGLVLILLVLDYVAVSAITDNAWGRVVIVVLLGATLLFALRTSHARRIWQLLAALYLVVSTLVTVVSILVPSATDFSTQTSLVGGLLLLITPVAISRRIVAHRFVTTETVLGAICVYLLIGFSFSFIYSAIGFVSGAPFFGGQTQATANDYLFFSYTTLTTVGYGDLVPAASVGQTFAMLEALFGQIYLVIVVARLVSLWGQERPAPPPKHGENAEKPGATSASREPDPNAHAS